MIADLDCDILAGVPFMRMNDIILDIPHDTIIVSPNHKIPYAINHSLHDKTTSQVRRSQSFLIRAQDKATILPGEYIEVQNPIELSTDCEIAIEPRCDSQSMWVSPCLTHSVGGVIRIPNLSSEPVSIKKHQHIAQVRYTCNSAVGQFTPPIAKRSHEPAKAINSKHSADVTLDPDKQLLCREKLAFIAINEKYDSVFNPMIGKYNDASGKIKASINMGPVEPPPQKGRLPLSL